MMETLAYIHLALAYEAPATVDSVPPLANVEEQKHQKLSCRAGIPVLSVALTVALLGMASEASAVQREDTGSGVKTLQNRLIAAKYYDGPVTGYYGSMTETAVRQFQAANGLAVDGVAGAETLAALQRYLERSNKPAVVSRVGKRGLRQGDQGTEVREVQQRLKVLGLYPGKVDLKFGSKTEQAVKQFQASRGLVVDGVVGRETWFALWCLGSSNSPYVVIVPTVDGNTLNQLLQYVPNAYPDKTSNGAYLYAGAYPNQAKAEKQAEWLQSQGFITRVVYLR